MADHSITSPWFPLEDARYLSPNAIMRVGGSWHIFKPPQVTTPEQSRVMELEAEVSRLKGLLNAVDDGSCAAEPVAIETGEGESQANKTPVDHVIDMLDKRMIVTPDKARLRKALDKADAPMGGRAGADAGLGRAIGRPAQFGVGYATGR